MLDIWQEWAGTWPPPEHGERWGVPELWWYQKAQVFTWNTSVHIDAGDATSFKLAGVLKEGQENGGFGVQFSWGQPLESGYIYEFTMRMEHMEALPDQISIGQSVVWIRQEGYNPYPDIRFSYVPQEDREKITIYMVKRATDCKTLLYPPHQGVWHNHNMRSVRKPWRQGRPSYPPFALPPEADVISITPQIACSDLRAKYLKPAAYDQSKLLYLPYPADDLKIIERGISPTTGKDYFAVGGLDIITYQPHRHNYNTFFEDWAKAAVRQGVKEIAVCPVMEWSDIGESEGITGNYQFYHWCTIIDGGKHQYRENKPWDLQIRKEKLSVAVKRCASIIKQWFELVPDGKAYMFNVEMSGSFGTYQEGIAKSPVGILPGYERVRDGGVKAWETVFAFFRDLRRQLEEELGEAASRVTHIANFDRAAFQGAYAYHAGIDVILHKNIHRQSLNLVTASSRGAASAYGKDFGLDMDVWDRNYWYSYEMREMWQGLLVYYHCGAKYLMDEIPVWCFEENTLSHWGKTWLDFCRYGKSHPRRGEQKVRIAFMRGLGDEWNRAAGPSAGWEAAESMPLVEMEMAFEKQPPDPKWVKAYLAKQKTGTVTGYDTYINDYNLLDMVFAQFGSHRRTDPNRLCTGTPYGPVDFIPWDTHFQKLKQYEVVVYLGRGITSCPETLENLEEYVAAGGTVVMAAGQCKGEEGKLIANRLMSIGMKSPKELNQLPYTLLDASEDTCTVEAELENGDPLLVKSTYIKGRLYLFAGEWLTYFGDKTVRKLLRGLFGGVRRVEFSPFSDWLEYMVQRKQRTWMFSLFNHGRGFFPSCNGKDQGAWQGEMIIPLEYLELEFSKVKVYAVQYEPKGELPFVLKLLTAYEKSGQLHIPLHIDDFMEIVIGDSTQAELDFYS